MKTEDMTPVQLIARVKELEEQLDVSRAKTGYARDKLFYAAAAMQDDPKYKSTYDLCWKAIHFIDTWVGPVGKPNFVDPTKLYVILRSNPLGADLWWRPDAHGYTDQIIEAGIFTHEDATRYARSKPDEDSVVPLTEALDRMRANADLVAMLARKQGM